MPFGDRYYSDQLEYKKEEIFVEDQRQVRKYFVVESAYLLLKSFIDCDQVYLSIGLTILYFHRLLLDEDKIPHLHTFLQLINHHPIILHRMLSTVLLDQFIDEPSLIR